MEDKWVLIGKWLLIGTTAATALFALIGGGLMLYFLQRPRIRLLEPEKMKAEWYFDWSGGEKHYPSVRITPNILNLGSEPTHLRFAFEGHFDKDPTV